MNNRDRYANHVYCSVRARWEELTNSERFEEWLEDHEDEIRNDFEDKFGEIDSDKQEERFENWFELPETENNYRIRFENSVANWLDGESANNYEAQFGYLGI